MTQHISKPITFTWTPKSPKSRIPLSCSFIKSAKNRTLENPFSHKDQFCPRISNYARQSPLSNSNNLKIKAISISPRRYVDVMLKLDGSGRVNCSVKKKIPRRICTTFNVIILHMQYSLGCQTREWVPCKWMCT